FIQLTGTTPARYLREELIRQGVRKTGTTTFLPLGKKHVQKLVEDGLLRKRLFPNKFKVTKDWVRLARGKTGLLPKG
ncbi:MAG: hypothetical protein NTY48_06185, partial [Candidatus Diapherotrites archaeon]|nr:hypothetical protein [Candidatus Diapherotrites archaeon]